jgi:hypothetical protein
MMLLQDLLWLILSVVIVRGVWRLIEGVIEGLQGPSRSGWPGSQGRSGRSTGGVPATGVQMVRDPVCGTYVVPDRALTISDGARQVSFCSPECRDKYRARTA